MIVGDRVRFFLSDPCWWPIPPESRRGWRFGRIIGRHRDDIGVAPSGLEFATVRFEDDGARIIDLAVPLFRLDIVEVPC